MLTYQDGGGEWERRDGRRQSYGGGARQSGDLDQGPGCCQVAPCRDKSSTRRHEKVGTFANPIIGLKVCNIFVFLISVHIIVLPQRYIEIFNTSIQIFTKYTHTSKTHETHHVT